MRVHGHGLPQSALGLRKIIGLDQGFAATGQQVGVVRVLPQSFAVAAESANSGFLGGDRFAVAMLPEAQFVIALAVGRIVLQLRFDLGDAGGCFRRAVEHIEVAGIVEVETIIRRVERDAQGRRTGQSCR